MAGTKTPLAISASGTPDEPTIENIVGAINSLITPDNKKQPKVAAPAFYIDNAKPSDSAPLKLKEEYDKLHGLLLLAQIDAKSGDSRKLENAMHWIDNLNIPGGNAYDKLFALERRINDANNTRNNDASILLASLIGSQVNKASKGAQQAIGQS